VMSAKIVTPTEESSENWPEFEAAIEQYQAELHAFAYRVLGGRAEAEDALQNAYLKAFRVAMTGERAATRRPWLYRVVYTCCVDELRRSARTAHDVLDEVTSPSIDIDLGSVRALSDALLGLPVPSRAVVLLVDVHGLSYEEAAVALDLPRGTVASRLNQGRGILRNALEAHDHGGNNG
jgi:RNA polymerase sigma factor (sigma-70 family)